MPFSLRPVSLKDLMQDALIIAKNGGADVFNALDLMGSTEMLSDLKFGPGDGALQCVFRASCRLRRAVASFASRFYVFNWRAPQMSSEHVGLVLL
jgi:glycylpeptide N-tetradecanoyltransferase